MLNLTLSSLYKIKNLAIQNIPYVIKNNELLFIESNLLFKDLVGIKPNTSVTGMTDFELPCEAVEFASTFQEQDRQVIATGKSLKILDLHPYCNNQWKMLLAFKDPLINTDGDIIGALTYAMDITNSYQLVAQTLETSIVSSRQTTQKRKKINFYLDPANIDFQLTTKQSECLFFLLRAKTVKQIAQLMSISPRTVEDHIGQLKLKFNCSSKSDLIDCALNAGFLHRIPEHLFRKQFSKVLL